MFFRTQPRFRSVPVVAAALVLANLPVIAPASAQELKIGVFDAQKISEQTAAGARLQTRIASLTEKRRAEIEALTQELDKRRQEYIATSSSLSEEKRKQLGLELQRATNELEAKRKSATQEVQLEVEAAQAEWQQKILQAVAKYGSENGYSLILPAEVVVFYANAIDITDELVEVVDALPDAAAEGEAAEGP